jgi:hypothetical protein
MKLVESNKANTVAFIKQISELISNSRPATSQQLRSSQGIELLNAENANLKAKNEQLEEKCKQLQLKLDLSLRTQSELHKKYLRVNENPDESVHFNFKPPNEAAVNSSKQDQPSNEPVLTPTGNSKAQPTLEIHPPLRARLQKLNEKSVALKWAHNPRNALISLTGYTIYINEEQCAELNPHDQIASINGLQDEGEYRICVRARCGELESASSNVVVTRVKKKQKKVGTATSSNNSTSETAAVNTASAVDVKDPVRQIRSSADFNNELDASAKDKDESIEKKLEQIRNSFILGSSNLNRSSSNVESVRRNQATSDRSRVDAIYKSSTKPAVKNEDEEAGLGKIF